MKLLIAIWLCLTTSCLADVRLPKTIGSQMVLQQMDEAIIWGWADPNEKIEIRADWNKDRESVVADANGRWAVKLPTGPAGGPYSIRIQGQNQIYLRDILLGEVWIASGQSNMEMPFIRLSNAYTGIHAADREVANANFPSIRLFQVGNFNSSTPQDDVDPGTPMYGVPPAACEWQACSPDNVATFASTAYFFARHLHQQLNIPIGIIDASWGGTPAEAWTPAQNLKTLADSLAAETRPQNASRLYNGMIHPLRNISIRGVIWYQGESNVGRASEYTSLFKTMITSWRKVWNRDFPFYFVQIAPFNYPQDNAAYLRDAQRNTLDLPKTGMAVTMDIGNATDIHPKNKQEVGRRLALWALAKDYGQDVAYSGPLFRESVREGGRIRLKFDHVADGLATNDDQPPSHFEISGENRVFHPATAKIDGPEIIVSADEVAEPIAVRYAFSSDAEPNLMNRAGLPASSFRTDRWAQE